MKVTTLRGGRLDATHLAAGEDGKTLDKAGLFVYTGTHESMDGPVTVTDEMLERLVANHNVRMAAARAAGDFVPSLLPPVQLDHSSSATVTVGRVLPTPLRLERAVIDGEERLAVFGSARFLGAENAEKAKDGRWVHLSVGADFDAGVLKELTVTPFPAAGRASLLSQGDDMKFSKEQLATLKKRLMDKDEKLSEKDADEKLSKMSDDEKKAELAAADDDEKKKLAAEEDDKKKKEELHAANAATVARLAAGRENITKLGVAAGEQLKKARLAAVAGNISVRLAKLQSRAKITPAERKTINVTELAGKGADVVEAVLDSYEKRQPVVFVGQLGTVQAVDIATVSKEVKLAQLEDETRKNLGKKKKDGTTQLAQQQPGVASVRLAEGDTTEDGKKKEELAATVERFTSMVGDIEKAAQSGNIQDLMAKCKSLRDLMHFTAEGMAMPDADAHMSRLSSEVEALGTQLSAFQAAVTEMLGA